MKNILLLQFLIVAHLGLFAQNWFPLGATWHYSRIVIDTTTGYFYNSYFKMSVSKDTLISGDVYKIIHRENGSCDLMPAKIFIKETANVVTILKDDMVSIDTLMNLNKNIGDSWVIHPNSMVSNDSVIVTVLGKGQKIINGDTLTAMKISVLSSEWEWSGTDSIIEKIGFYPGYFFSQYYQCDFQIGMLRCYEDHNLGVFETGISTTCEEEIGAGIFELKKHGHVFPNPASDKIRIIWDQPIEKVSILSIDNKEISSIYTDNNFDILLNLSNIPNGYYLIKVESNLDTHYVKVVKFN